MATSKPTTFSSLPLEPSTLANHLIFWLSYKAVYLSELTSKVAYSREPHYQHRRHLHPHPITIAIPSPSTYVSLSLGLTEDDFYRILTEPECNLIRQQIELLSTEGVFYKPSHPHPHPITLPSPSPISSIPQITLEVTDAAIREMAFVAAHVNTTVENIGARRLHTIIERYETIM